MTTPSLKIIYDLGANNGDDIPYYLKKSDLVVAVEANPILCKQIENRFSTEIKSGRLVVENCVLTADDEKAKVYFYIHKHRHILSQFPEPNNSEEFDKVLLPSQSIIHLIQKHGEPYYIKSDLENYDEIILKTLFLHDISPAYISAEVHDVKIFTLLVSMGDYNAFKLVDGKSVSRQYGGHTITVQDRKESYSFPHQSAGPFGDDIDGPWMSRNNFFRLLAFEGLGWKDVHATNQSLPDQSFAPGVCACSKALMYMLIPKPILRFFIKALSFLKTRLAVISNTEKSNS